jgi:hypothetical protein
VDSPNCPDSPRFVECFVITSLLFRGRYLSNHVRELIGLLGFRSYHGTSPRHLLFRGIGALQRHSEALHVAECAPAVSPLKHHSSRVVVVFSNIVSIISLPTLTASGNRGSKYFWIFSKRSRYESKAPNETQSDQACPNFSHVFYVSVEGAQEECDGTVLLSFPESIMKYCFGHLLVLQR